MRRREGWFVVALASVFAGACAGPRRACCPCAGPTSGPVAVSVPGGAAPGTLPTEAGEGGPGPTAYGVEDGRVPGRGAPVVTPGPGTFDVARALSDRVRALGVPPRRTKADHALYDAWSSIVRPRSGRLETRVAWLTDARHWAIRTRGERPAVLAADRWDEGCRQLADLYAILGGALAQYQQVRWKWEEGAIGIMAVSGSGADGAGERESGHGGGRSGERGGHSDEGGGRGGRSGGGRGAGSDGHGDHSPDGEGHEGRAGDRPPDRRRDREGPGGDHHAGDGEDEAPHEGGHGDATAEMPERTVPTHPIGRPADDAYAVAEPDADVDLAEAVLQYRRSKEETLAQARQKQLARAKEIAAGIEAGLERIRKELHDVQADTVGLASTLLAAESRRLEEEARHLPESRRAEAEDLLDQMYVASLLLEGAKDQPPSRFGAMLRQNWLRPRNLLVKLLAEASADDDSGK